MKNTNSRNNLTIIVGNWLYVMRGHKRQAGTLMSDFTLRVCEAAE